MNKIILLCAVCTVLLTACENSASGTSDAASGQVQSSIQTDNSVSADSSETNRENENSGLDSILIAYFTAAENSGVDAISSASYTKVNGEAVGRIRAVADMIADNTGGELFSIKTETVYPTDGRNLSTMQPRRRIIMSVLCLQAILKTSMITM